MEINVPNNLVNHYLKHTNLRANNKGYTIVDIFRDFWDPFLKDNSHLNIRDDVFDNVNRMLLCRTPELGYSFYDCPNCSNFWIAFNTCKSRFCNSCGVKYAKARSLTVNNVLLNCSHRHITFTIPKSIQHYFRSDRRRLSLLFEAVNETLKYLFKRQGRIKDYQAGYILVLHTFGRALNFNAHIHCLISEGMIDKLGIFKVMKHFNYELLRKSFMKSLLDLLHKELGNGFYQEKCQLYKENDQGFYVHAPNKSDDFKDHKKLVDYVLRYTGRPAMAQSRIILTYEDMVEYYYEPHEDDHLPDEEKEGRVIVTVHEYEFIKKLIIHIPNREFKTIRYYGLYSSKGRKRRKNFKRKVSYRNLHKPLKWRNLIYKTFKYDILKCECGALMEYKRESSYFP